MTRKIEFRAWDKTIKKMILANIIDFRDNRVASVETFDGYKIKGDLNFTLMQWTGLLDKKGVKIFEGDIVASSYNGYSKLGEVIWNNFDLGWYIGTKESWKLRESMGSETEVLGNIYENNYNNII
jgi:uncharacterized phage protein (TIGR01671 family)